ncbi:MAG: translation initiation factor IF-3 [Candidatus Sungbacteria bacterium]|nr:translation initiation factor IF-3 [Candidatus Sungbacteria bacterium]
MDEKGQIGVLPLEEALKLAHERKLDLVEIAPTAKPPVVKIIDFGKFKYEKERTEREHRGKQKETETKMLRIGYNTGKHDLERYAGKAKDFLEEKNKVRIDMVLRGREKAHRDFAKKRFEEFLALIPNHALDAPIKSTPQGFTGTIRPA